MAKKFVLFVLFFVVMPILVNASATSVTKIGNKFYDTLEEAIANASSTDVITLVSNVKLKDTIQINKTINIDLNGKSIVAYSKVFQVQGGTLNLTGPGTIKEENPNYGAIYVVGSDNSNDNSYSVVNIEKDVTLEGWSGIFITHDNSKSYGVIVNLDGNINAINDASGNTGIGVYVNGNIKHQNNYPVINITDNAKITSTGNGLYIAGYSTFNIGKAYISGLESGIGIKAGTLNIDGAIVICDGIDNTPTEGNNNGVNPSGVALQIESNNGYAGNMKINIKNGNFKSKNSNVIYEYIGKGSSSLVDEFNISNGSFISEANKNVFSLSNSFKSNHPSFITGGKYSSNPSDYLKTGYSTSLENNLYNVVKSTMKETFFTNNNSFGKLVIIFGLFITLLTFGYFNREKIVKLLNK